jgi:hypothetical protein
VELAEGVRGYARGAYVQRGEAAVILDTTPLHPELGREDLELAVAGDVSVYEPKGEWLRKRLADAVELQQELANLPLSERLRAVELLGEAWREKLESGKLEWVKEELAKATGYSPAIVDLEVEFVAEVLNPGNIAKALDTALVGGSRSLEEPVEVAARERVRNLPAGPVLVIGSGNSIVPPLIPTVFSLVIGNFTILRPSLANFRAVREVFSPLHSLPLDVSLRRALLVSYFAHESRNLRELLERGPLGVVNYWGGEPGRTAVARMLAANPHRPRFVVNGPMTGFAIVDSSCATVEVAEKLAFEMVLYEQQLCSSPTQAAFVGSKEEALGFAEKLASSLEKVGKRYPVQLESLPYALFVMRRSLELAGAKVYASSDPSNPWTIALSDGKSALGEVPPNALLPLHARRRFLEIVRVNSTREALNLVASLPRNPAYLGVDRVQTLAVAVDRGALEEILRNLHRIGVYRVVPLGESYLRTPVEPYDGLFLPAAFSYSVYIRG